MLASAGSNPAEDTAEDPLVRVRQGLLMAVGGIGRPARFWPGRHSRFEAWAASNAFLAQLVRARSW